MQSLEVGKPYKEGVSRIPEGIVFDFNDSNGFLRISFYAPTKEEIEEVKKGEIELGILQKEGIIFLFFRFGKLDWMDTPYNVALSQPCELQELTEETKGYAVQVVLIDGMAGIIQALKLIELPHEMSLRFKLMVEYQKENPVKEYDENLNIIFSRFSTDELLQEAEIYSL